MFGIVYNNYFSPSNTSQNTISKTGFDRPFEYTDMATKINYGPDWPKFVPQLSTTLINFILATAHSNVLGM